jgi:hypothetical protein
MPFVARRARMIPSVWTVGGLHWFRQGFRRPKGHGALGIRTDDLGPVKRCTSGREEMPQGHNWIACPMAEIE